MSDFGDGGMCLPVLSTSKGKVINQLLLCIHLFSIIPICHAICDAKPKSCNRSYVHSCVPRILEDFPNDPWVGTANDFNCSLWQLSDCVGRHSIARPWFPQGLVGLVAFLCICRWVLPLHYHPLLYIVCYLVVKVGALIWQVSTKRNSNRLILILLV